MAWVVMLGGVRVAVAAALVCLSLSASAATAPSDSDETRVVFTPPVNVSNTDRLAGSPAIAVDELGIVSLVWEEASAAASFSRSVDAGNSFSPPRPALPESVGISPGDVDLATTTGGSTHVTATAYDVFLGGAEIFYTATVDGSTFRSPLLVSPWDGVNSIVSSVVTDGASLVGVAWYESGEFTGRSEIGFRRSLDAGSTFSDPLVLSNPDTGSAYCPDLAQGSGNLYAAWVQGPSLVPDILFSRSTDEGASFGEPLNVSQMPEKSWCPRIAVDGTGTIYLVWQEGPAFETDVYFARSVDGGMSFETPVPLSEPGVRSFCPALAAEGNGRVYITWSTVESLSETLQSHLRLSSDSGASFSDSQIIPMIDGSGGCPRIASEKPYRLDVVWHEVPPGDRWFDVFYSRGRVVPGGSVITVTSLTDDTNLDGMVTLREAIIAANTDTSVDGSTPGSGTDEIVFATGAGTILLNGSQLPVITDDLLINGLGADQLALDAGAASRVLEVGVGVYAELSRLTLTNGMSSAHGGAILNHGTLTIRSSTLHGSAVEGNGGAVFNDGQLSLFDVLLSGNSALNGGALYNSGLLAIRDSTLQGNFTGGIAAFVGGGGAIINADGGIATVTKSTVSGNSAANGGGIANVVASSLTISNSTLSGNEAIGGGGGLASVSSALTILQSTITANRANTGDDSFPHGGGIEASACCSLPVPPMALDNSIVAGNLNGSVASEEDQDVSIDAGTIDPSSSFNVIGVDTGVTGISDGVGGNQIGTSQTPLDPLLRGLEDNGGGTMTHALLAGSLALDAAGACDLPEDQRGAARVGPCDSGAFELVGCAPLILSNHIVVGVETWSACQAVELGPNVIVEEGGHLTVSAGVRVVVESPASFSSFRVVIDPALDVTGAPSREP